MTLSRKLSALMVPLNNQQQLLKESGTGTEKIPRFFLSDRIPPPYTLMFLFLLRVDINVAARVTPELMRPTINRARNRVYPRVPISLYNLGNLLQQPQNANITATIDGVDSIFDGAVNLPNGKSSTIFVSRRMKRFMRRVRTVFCDGTFGSRPNIPPSAQVLQLSAVVRNHVSYSKAFHDLRA